MTWTKREIDEAKQTLSEYIKPGDTLLTKITHVSRSGMLRIVEVYRPGEDGMPENISRLVAKATDMGFDEKRYGIQISGCGFSAEHDVVYNLGYALFSKGFNCIGEKCPSNDHVNGDRNYKPHMHTSGGYALKQRSF